MSPTQPSAGEIMRRLDEVVTRLDKLADTLSESYVRKDVLDAMHNTTGIQLLGIEDEQRVIHKRIDKMQDTAATNRRVAVSAFIAPIVVGIVVVLILSTLGIHR